MDIETEEAAVQVVVADNQDVARIGTRRVLDKAASIEVVAEADNGKAALRLARELTPDVLVTEVALPGLSGIQLAVRLADAPVRVLAFTAAEDDQYVRYLLDERIDGYLKKQEDAHYLVEAVRALARGEERWVSPRIARRVTALKQRKDGATLLDAYDVTSRERDVLRLVARGLPNAEIADELFISQTTVRTHVSHLYDKLGMHDRPAVVAWAWKSGLMGEG